MVQTGGQAADSSVMLEKWHFALLVIPLSVLAAWWRYARYESDPEWELRWQQLPPGERERLAEAAYSDEPPEDPEEAWLAAGSARAKEEVWFDAPWKRFAATVAAVAALLALAAVVADLTA